MSENEWKIIGLVHNFIEEKENSLLPQNGLDWAQRTQRILNLILLIEHANYLTTFHVANPSWFILYALGSVLLSSILQKFYA